MCASATPHSSAVGKSFGTGRMAKEDLVFARLPNTLGGARNGVPWAWEMIRNYAYL